MLQQRGSLNDFLQRVGIVLLLAALAFMAWKAADVLLLIFFGVFVGMLLVTFTEWVKRVTPFGWRWSLGVVMVLLLVLLAGISWFIGPRLAQQTGNFNEQFTASVNSLEQRLAGSELGRTLLQSVPMLEAPGVSNESLSLDEPVEAPAPDPEGAATGRAETQGGAATIGVNVFSQAFSLLMTIVQTLADLVLVLFVAIFVAVNPKLYQEGIVMLFPKPRHDRVRYVLKELGRTIQGWLLVELVTMTVIGVLIWVGLTLIGMKLALVLAFLAFLLEFVPFIGPWLAYAPAALIALSMGGSTLLWVTLLYILANQIEGNLLLPILEEWAVDVPPALTLSAVFVFGALFGFVGVLVAAPLIAVLFVFVKLLYVEATLHEEVTTPLEK